MKKQVRTHTIGPRTFVERRIHREIKENGIDVGVYETYLSSQAVLDGQASCVYDPLLRREKVFEGGHRVVTEYEYEYSGSLQKTSETTTNYDYLGNPRLRVQKDLKKDTTTTTHYHDGYTEEVIETPTQVIKKTISDNRLPVIALIARQGGHVCTRGTSR